VTLNRWLVRSAFVLLALGMAIAPAVSVLAAQQRPPKQRRVANGPDEDGDGVPDAQDRCPGTPAGQRVGPDGCPIHLLRPGEQPTEAAAPAAGRAATVTTQAAVRPGATPGAFTAGLAMVPYAGTTDADRNAYVARFVLQLDSAVVTLVDVFRNTTGQPVAGAENPTSLSQRERDRWARCRDLHFDLLSYQSALHDVARHLPTSGTLPRAAAALDSALGAVQATAECDNISSMIAAPARWTPWGPQYEASAGNFYRDWYTQVREADDRNRAFVIAFNAAVGASGRVVVPPALPRTPPYVGAGPR